MTSLLFFRVVDGPVNIRQQPDTDAARVSSVLNTGQQIEVDPASRTENDNYVWWKHQLGWSAERHVTDAAKVFLTKIELAASNGNGSRAAVVNTNTTETLMLPTGKTIERPALFSRHPVALEQTDWIQYFGNTVFASNLQFDRNPSRQRMYFYCQGLHGGIDYGSNTSGVPIFAGINGIVDKVELGAKSYSPNCVRVNVGDFTVIYGHMGNVPPLKKGDAVTPDTRMGEIEPIQDHLHLEVRYKNTWVINPLLLMPVEVSNAMLQKFPKFTKCFFCDAAWNQWLTPFDQPVLKLSAADKAQIIGPRAARG
jgi:murein DD-endopeptidase MepM/ murein hydrolase activator NlpD